MGSWVQVPSNRPRACAGVANIDAALRCAAGDLVRRRSDNDEGACCHWQGLLHCALVYYIGVIKKIQSAASGCD
jgi:hypothetical protein